YQRVSFILQKTDAQGFDMGVNFNLIGFVLDKLGRNTEALISYKKAILMFCKSPGRVLKTGVSGVLIYYLKTLLLRYKNTGSSSLGLKNRLRPSLILALGENHPIITSLSVL